MYFSPNIVKFIISRRMRDSGHVERMEDVRNVYRVFVVKPERKRLLGRNMCRLENDIRMECKERVCKGVDWVLLPHGRRESRTVVKTITELPVLKNAGKFLT